MSKIIGNTVGTTMLRPDWAETNEKSSAYIGNKPTANDAIELLMEMNLVEPVVAEDGSVYTDENGAMYTIV